MTICLVLNYLGQAAWLLRHLGPEPGEKNLFFLMIPPALLLPAIARCTLATITASQALISGSFMLVVGALRLNLGPKTGGVPPKPAAPFHPKNKKPRQQLTGP